MIGWFASFYFREGPGIDKDAPRPKGLRLLGATLGREWWDLVRLNLLFLAASLPLITLPAAYLAMVSVTVAMIEDRNVYLWRDFAAALRAYWLPAGLFGIVLGAAGGLCWLALSTYALAAGSSLLFAFPLMIAVTTTTLLAVLAPHMFVALAVGGDRPLAVIVKASLIGMIVRPLPGFAALAIVAASWLVQILFYPATVLLPILIDFSLGALVTSFAALEGVRLGFSRLRADAWHEAVGGPEVQSA